MTSQRTLLDACLGLLALSALLAPNAMALGIDDVPVVGETIDDSALGAALDAACSGEGTNEEELHGTLSINGLGSFPLVIQPGGASNGCGGSGCDDTFSGEFASNGRTDRYVGMNEGFRQDNGDCEVACAFVGATHSYNTPYPTTDYGYVSVDVRDNVVDFYCEKPDGDWVFHGHASRYG